ncbi:MarR family winged helix-turn-helix transcriptional regulator [Apilactobacillus ozensis]|uniref:MarR family winged helix-turn-helix transcriptional regulator n=1 Tax=Apilactobacillus ozensis TaxID=866801 RepID=UPI00200B47FF|nr:MarR family transcriptional regulator [Apilactobacillus ozensis]MCK8607162.1 MarR family transcriptional regulator [Apilactobacillus ozensis]
MENFAQSLKMAETLLTKTLDNSISKLFHNLTSNQVVILFYLHDHITSVTRQVDLENNLNISHSTIRGTIKRLIKTGLIETKPMPRDKRQVQVILSQDGLNMLNDNKQEFEDIMNDTLKKAVKGLGVEDIQSFQRINHQIIKNLK